MPVLGDREAAGNVRRKAHRRRAARRDALLDVVAMQVQRNRSVARPTQNQVVAPCDLDRPAFGWHVAFGERNVEDLLRGERIAHGKDAHDQDEQCFHRG